MNTKPKLKHDKKKFTENDYLPGIDQKNDSLASIPALCSSQQLEPFVRMDDSALRRREREINPRSNKPWIPPAKLGKRITRDTLCGIAEWWEFQLQNKSAVDVFPNLEAFSRATGLSRGLLKDMKADRCAGFHSSGRIYLFEFLAGLETWLAGKTENDAFELRSEKVSSYSEMREKYQARNEKKKNEQLNSQSITKAIAIEVMQTLRTIHFEGYERQVQELPALLAGKSAAQIRFELSKYIDQIKSAENNTVEALAKSATELSAAEPEDDHAPKSE